MNSTDSQNDGVAMQAMEKMRMTWSGQRSRYRAETTPRMALATMAMMKPKKPSCSVMGSAVAMPSGHGLVRGTERAQIAMEEADHVVAVANDQRIVEAVLDAVGLQLVG